MPSISRPASLILVSDANSVSKSSRLMDLLSFFPAMAGMRRQREIESRMQVRDKDEDKENKLRSRVELPDC